jgi:carbonic anhydrase
MTVSVRSSLALGALALVALACVALAEPPANGEEPATAISTGLAKDFCATGQQQSPVDLANAIPAAAKMPTFNWKPVRGGMVVNTGATIELDIEGAGGVTIDGTTYALKQVRFHHPSEHTIGGKSFPLEAHLVHASVDGRLAVIGVLFEEGAANPMLDPVWATAPGRAGKAAVAFAIDPAKLVGAATSAFQYEGSLTAPPCSETVTWSVLAKPVAASRSQIAAFAAMFPNNARPVQPLNRRYVLKTGD